jgi:pimeloyl-ACP methyl ester carboxylesterase
MEEPTSAAITGPAVSYDEGFVDADEFHIRYLEAGNGPPIVCLHGAGGLRLSPDHDLLARHHRVILFEVPGFGDSPANDRSGSMKELAGTMCEAVANLGLSSITLLGCSFGSLLAAWMAVQRPEQLESLVLSGPVAIPPDWPGGSPPPDPTVAYAHPERIPAWWPPDDPAVQAKQRDLLQRVAVPLRRNPELEAGMAELQVPTLVLIGASDRLVPPEMGDQYQALLPKCHVALIHDAGHVISVDRPVALVAVVEEFVADPDSFLGTQTSGFLYG